MTAILARLPDEKDDPKWVRAIRLRANGWSLHGIAHKLKLGERTLERWSTEPGFADRVVALQEEWQHKGRTDVRKYASGMPRVLYDIANDTEVDAEGKYRVAPGTRVSAAKALMTFAGYTPATKLEIDMSTDAPNQVDPDKFRALMSLSADELDRLAELRRRVDAIDVTPADAPARAIIDAHPEKA